MSALFGASSIAAAARVGPFAFLSEAEQETPFRRRQARDVLVAAVATLDPDELVERACAGKWAPHWPQVPNAVGERMAMRDALAAIGLGA